MTVPNITIVVEPRESGSVVALLLAPPAAGGQPSAQLSLQLLITNNGVTALHAHQVALSFTAPPVVNDVSIPLDLSIPAAQTAEWHFATANNIVLPFPMPASMSVSVSCDGFTMPATVTNPLAFHESPTTPGSYHFPSRGPDLLEGEYWRGRSAHHGPAGGGVQLFAYDLSVAAFTGSSWSRLLPRTNGTKNEHYRIWGKPVYAMAHGSVDSFLNDQPTNPNPPADLSPPGTVEGNHFYIQHGDELVLYAHFQPGSLNPSLLQEGAAVKEGQFLGHVGNSGNSTEPHLHLHAIKGVAPWQGPLRPIPFRGAEAIAQSEMAQGDPAPPWFTMTQHGPPEQLALIKPDPIWVVPPSGEAAIDPLALILSNTVYVKLTLPDPPPIEVLRAQIRDIVRGMSAGERKQALARLRVVSAYADALARELEQDFKA